MSIRIVVVRCQILFVSSLLIPRRACVNLFSFRAVREQLQVVIYHRDGSAMYSGRCTWQYLFRCGWGGRGRKRFCC